MNTLNIDAVFRIDVSTPKRTGDVVGTISISGAGVIWQDTYPPDTTPRQVLDDMLDSWRTLLRGFRVAAEKTRQLSSEGDDGRVQVTWDAPREPYQRGAS